MTYQDHFTVPDEILQQIATEGFDALPELIRVLMNAAMQIERQKYLGVGPYERSSERQGRANGFKPKTMRTRMGEITLDVPQVREGGFYPEALEKGQRSERALTLALAEMYVQGVSTRKVKAITEQLCGTAISSSQVSRAAATLDETLEGLAESAFGRDRLSLSGCPLREGASRWPDTRCGYPDGQWRRSAGQAPDLGRLGLLE